MTKKLSAKDLDFLKQLANQMAKRDNQCTASPFYYVIRHTETFHTKEGYGDDIVYVDMIDDYEEFSDKEEARSAFKEYGMNEEEAEERISQLERFGVGSREVYGSNIFLTKEAAQAHMKQNAHHMKEGASIFVVHGWRNPQLEKLFEIIEKFAE